MSYLLPDISLALGNLDADDSGWVQLLVFVVMGVIYALASILRAKGKKVQFEQESKEELARKPAQPAQRGRAVPKKVSQQRGRVARPAPSGKYPVTVRQQPHRKMARPPRVTRRPAAEKKPAVDMPTLERLEEAIGPQIDAEVEELPQLTTKTVEKVTGKPGAVPAEPVSVKYLSDILSDYADPDDLSRAILHYEILGRPLSLRRPGDNVVGP